MNINGAELTIDVADEAEEQQLLGALQLVLHLELIGHLLCLLSTFSLSFLKNRSGQQKVIFMLNANLLKLIVIKSLKSKFDIFMAN